MKQQPQYRHGDLLIIPVGKLPSESKKKKDRVLAYGEVTGHAHRLDKGAVKYMNEERDPNGESWDTIGVAYFEVKKKARLTHEEHGPIVFEPGTYKVIRQREYTPEGSIQVAD